MIWVKVALLPFAPGQILSQNWLDKKCKHYFLVLKNSKIPRVPSFDCTGIHTHKHTHTHTHTDTHTHIHTHTLVHTNTCTHTHTHAHFGMQSPDMYCTIHMLFFCFFWAALWGLVGWRNCFCFHCVLWKKIFYRIWNILLAMNMRVPT